ncbi:MAG: glutathione-dependent formaldehyde dehydrogenase [Archangiaceae bacterium]|nr:glutathione-dependent formaldehyde dehydrogenase [Archangiaceae bacterium]
MKALVFHAPKKVSVDKVPDPKLEVSTDALVRVTSTAICGSDLHIYNGFFPQKKPLVMGHEFMGVVMEVGRDVKKLKPGERVVVPFPIACGSCWFCQHALAPHCEKSNPEHYGPEGGLLDQKGGALFGYTDLYGGYSGGQSEYVRVPFADVGPRKVPDALSDDQALFLSDIFPTGYTAIDWAKPKAGDTVVVLGCGPVGLMAMKSAWLLGAGRVIGVDREEYRLQRAKTAAKAEVLNVESDDVAEVVRGMTGGRGADVVVDAVGLEAHRTPLKKLTNVFHLQTGSMDALRTAIRTVRRGGTVSIVGVYGVPYDNFPLGQVFDKGITLKMGQAPVQALIDTLMDHVASGRVRLDDVISHHLPLEEAAKGYDIFCRKVDDCVKVVLRP